MMETADLPRLGAELSGRRHVRGGQHLRHPPAAAAAEHRRRHRRALGDQDDLRPLRRPARRRWSPGTRQPSTASAISATLRGHPGADGGLPRAARTAHRCRSGWRRPRPARRCWPNGWPSIRGSGGCAFPGCRTIPDTSGPGTPCPGSARCSRSSSPTAPTADAVVEACRLWVFATSLGGVESTLERRRRWPDELPTCPRDWSGCRSASSMSRISGPTSARPWTPLPSAPLLRRTSGPR